MKRIAVIGGGSFGTVIANLSAHNGCSVKLWMRDPIQAAAVNQARCNERYLPDLNLHESITVTADLAQAVDRAELLFIAIPSRYFRAAITALQPLLKDGVGVVSLTKGIEAPKFTLMSDILRELLPNQPIGVLGGPNLAKEIAQGHISGAVIASKNSEVCAAAHKALHGAVFRVYSSTDVQGVELGGSLKNVYAIVAGLAAALSVGENTQGILLTRALAEMSRFAVHLGADPLTFLGLSGVGDLFVTCSSPLSRNYQVGFQLGQGKKLETIVSELGQVAEGINTLELLKRQSDIHDIYMPLVKGLYAIVFENQELGQVISGLMSSEQVMDVSFTTQ